jgi:hypothetical protein
MGRLLDGLCYINDRKYKNTRVCFKSKTFYDPNSDLAAYARQYLETVESNLLYTRPLRVTLILSGGYDSNIISKPHQERLAGGTGNPSGGFISPSFLIKYVPDLEGPGYSGPSIPFPRPLMNTSFILGIR